MRELYGLELLEALSCAFGPSGCEDEVRELIRSQIEGSCDELYCDRIGSLIACVKGTGSRSKPLMIAAHMDEVGFMVTHIDSSGYIHFGCVGGIDPRVLCGRRVVLGDERKRTAGIIASKAIHQQSEAERREVTPVRSMYIDIGAKNQKDAESCIEPGDFGTFAPDFFRFGENGSMIAGKALDDRFGCAVMCDTLRELYRGNFRPEYDINFAFTVREEVGLSGAITAAYGIDPDRAIVLEATAISDIAGVADEKRVADAGCGGVISFADNSTVYDRDFINLALECAKSNNIKCRIKRYVSGGNDAGSIHKSRTGVKTLAISAPCRYLHSAFNVINADDYSSVCALLTALLHSPAMNFNGGIK